MNTKKIIEYRALLGVTKTATLKELKTIYRNCMKDIHPDTIQDDAERLAAEEKSTEIIAAYHFLVSKYSTGNFGKRQSRIYSNHNNYKHC